MVHRPAGKSERRRVQGATSSMFPAWRAVSGAVAAGLLAHVWLTRAANAELLVAIATVGSVGGVVMGSWWSVLAVPTAMYAGFELWHIIECGSCPRWSRDDSLGTLAVWNVIMCSIVALGAAVGTSVSRWLFRTGR